MSSNYHKQTASNDKNSSVARNHSKHSKSKALKKALKAELRERSSLVIHKNSAMNTTTKNNTKEHGSSRALEDDTQLSTENQKADHYIDAAYPRASYSKPEASLCPTPCKKYGESPIPKRIVALDPVGTKIEHLFATMKSPTNPVATSTMSRHSSAPTLEKNLPPTPAKKYANYPIKEKQKQYCMEPVSEISTTTSNNLCANYMTEENLSRSEATQSNHPSSPALSPEISRAKENMLETTHETVKLSTESQFFQAKTGEFVVPLGYRLGFGIVIAIAMMLIATVLVTYLGFSDFGNHGVGVSMEAPIKPHLDENMFCFNDFPNEFSPPELHDFLRAEISCRDDRKCPRRGRCYGGRLHDCTDGSDGEHGFNLFVPNERGDACVPSVEAVEYVKTVEGALLRLTAADACVQWRIPRDHYYPTFGLLAVVDEVNIDNHNVKPEFLPWLIPVLNSSRVIMEICSGLGDKNIGVMGLGPGVPPSELPLPFSCAATVKLSAWLRRCNHQLAAIYSGL